MTSYKFDGWFYLVFGLLLLWTEWWVLSSGKIKDQYVGWRMGQYVWLIFGGALTVLGTYILANN